jgi:DNA repair photolyase
MEAPIDLRWRLADDDAGQAALFGDAVPGRRALPAVEYLHVRARRVISAVPPTSRLPFRYTVNPYRGCTHACTYCFARPTHVYLGMDGGDDFDRRIVVKVNAIEVVQAELRDPRWGGEHVALGTNTDPYQPAEGRYRLTRGICEALVEAGNPFSILTKSSMIQRDLDVLAPAAAAGLFRAALSIGTVDDAIARQAEPGATPPSARLETLARLVDAGIPTGVLIAPILPGIGDAPEQLEAVVRACVEAGASSITPIVLHLRPGVRELFEPWLEEVRPDLRERYARLYHRVSGYAPEHQTRTAALVQSLCDDAGLVARPTPFRLATPRPIAPVQGARWALEQLALDLAG